MKKWEKNSPRAQMMLLASFGPVFIVLSSPASSSIDYIGSNIIAAHAGLLELVIASSGRGRQVRKTSESSTWTWIMWFVEGGL